MGGLREHRWYERIPRWRNQRERERRGEQLPEHSPSLVGQGVHVQQPGPERNHVQQPGPERKRSPPNPPAQFPGRPPGNASRVRHLAAPKKPGHSRPRHRPLVHPPLGDDRPSPQLDPHGRRSRAQPPHDGRPARPSRHDRHARLDLPRSLARARPRKALPRLARLRFERQRCPPQDVPSPGDHPRTRRLESSRRADQHHPSLAGCMHESPRRSIEFGESRQTTTSRHRRCRPFLISTVRPRPHAPGTTSWRRSSASTPRRARH